MNFHEKPATFVGHVKLKVQNLERSIQFYKEIIGFDILEQSSSTVKLTTDGKTSILSLEQPDDVIPKQGRTSGLYHFAILLPKRSDLANFVLHLAQKNIRLGAGDHLVSEALYFNDPDGNGIEVYADRDPSVWSWNNGEVAMTTEQVDFDDLVKSAERGHTWTKLPEDTVMGHVHLHVAELEKTEEFYVKGLGFDVVSRFSGQALFMSTEKYHHHIAVNTWNGVGAPTPPKNSVGLESYTLIYPSEEALNQTINNLEKIGVQVSNENGRFITTDPSGNQVELTV